MVEPIRRRIIVSEFTCTGNKVAIARAEAEFLTLAGKLKVLNVPAKAKFKMTGMVKNMQHLAVEFTGRPGSVYEGSIIKGTLILDDNYPVKNPLFFFDKVNGTTFQHINVYGGDNTCLDVLSEAGYNATMDLATIIRAVEELIYEPNPESPANIALLDLYKKDKPKYDEILKKQAEALRPKK